MQIKLDELVVAEKEADAADTAEGGEYGRESGQEMAAGREAYGEYGEYGDTSGEARGGEATGGENITENPYDRRERAMQPAADVDTGANDPDPLGFGELANEPPLEADSGFGPVAGPREPSAADYPGYDARTGRYASALVDRTQWASDYAAFHANFSPITGARGVPSLDWGELGELRAMNDAAEAHQHDSSADPERQQIREIADRLGEVRWQASVTGVDVPERGGPEVHFDLPALPEPLKIRFLGDISDHRTWSEIPPGQLVQFTGQFDIRTPNEIEVHIRMAE
jgi:hypothetical protein